ncbi:MAG: hypothetical protein ABI823_08440 [Bryobacteraceae bacterium]
MRTVLIVCATLTIAAALAPAQNPVITTVAGATPVSGAPVRGYAGDDGPAIASTLALANLQNECDPQRFEQTSNIAVDAAGTLYFADSNNQRIRRITPQGVISTYAGTGERPATDARCEATGTIGDNGQARSARLYNPAGVALHPNGNLIVADQQNNRIRQITPAGVITTIAGSGAHNLYAPGIPATSSPLDWPSAVAVDASGTVYFAELHGNRVAKIAADGRLVTVAGTGFPGSGGDGGQATAAQLRKPTGIAVDSSGAVYIADTGNHRVRRVGTDGVIRTIAGTGVQGFSGDGVSALSAMLDTPMDVKVDVAGTIYIADAGNHRVRRIDPQGVIRTLAGTGEPARGADYADAAESSMNFPSALGISAANELYIVDWQNYLIRRVVFDGDPAINPGGVVNDASFEAFPAPVAPGSIVAIFGVNLAADPRDAADGVWPKQLGATSVELNGVAIPLYYVSSSQLVGQLPYDLASGPVTAVVKRDGKSSNKVTLHIADASPGIFQSAGSKQAAALNQDGLTVNTSATPEARGNVVVVFLTGQGAVSLSVAPGESAPLDALAYATSSYSATIGGIDAAVQFLGLTPGSIGLAQANIVIPSGVTPGDAVPVMIEVGGRKSNPATIAVR